MPQQPVQIPINISAGIFHDKAVAVDVGVARRQLNATCRLNPVLAERKLVPIPGCRRYIAPGCRGVVGLSGTIGVFPGCFRMTGFVIGFGGNAFE